MRGMARNAAIALPVVVLLMALSASQPARADIAPYDSQGGGASGILCNQSEMRMRSFSVDVTVDLPEVHEVFTYLLDNPTGHGINQSVIIPIIFDADTSRHYTLDSADMTVDGANIAYEEGNITLDPALVIDSGKIIGLYANVSFPPNSTTNVTLDMVRSFSSYTQSFMYTYNARTASYWNGTISHGHFRLSYKSEFNQMQYSMPNGTKKGRVVTSDMYEWDGDAIYRVVVATGIRYQHVYPFTPDVLCLPLVAGVVTVVVVALVLIGRSRKKQVTR